MPLTPEQQAILDRLREYNSRPYNRDTNPHGLPYPGHVTEFPRALGDVASAAEIVGSLAVDSADAEAAVITATQKAAEAANSASAAAGSASTATTKAGEASASAIEAASSASTATTKAGEAANSASAAAGSESAAQAAKTAAETARDTANTHKTAAETAKTEAETAKAGAEAAQSAAAASATNAGNSATAAAGSASTASTKAGEAADSATTASNKASEAAGSASSAAADRVQTGQDRAYIDGIVADNDLRVTDAVNAANSAAGSAATAGTKAGEAAGSASAAAASASTASTKADEAAQSAADAAASAGSLDPLYTPSSVTPGNMVGWGDDRRTIVDLGPVPAGFSGDYNDLSNKPTLGTAAAQNTDAFATAAQGGKADSAVQPGQLKPVATSGSYNDLSDAPSIPAATPDASTTVKGKVQLATAAEIKAGTADRVVPTDTLWSAAQSYDLGNLSGTVALDFGNILGLAHGTLTGNITLGTVANAKPGQTVVFDLSQDAIGGRTLSLNSSYWLTSDGPVEWDTAANARNVLVATVLRDGKVFVTCATTAGGIS